MVARNIADLYTFCVCWMTRRKVLTSVERATADSTAVSAPYTKLMLPPSPVYIPVSTDSTTDVAVQTGIGIIRTPQLF